MKIAAIIPGLPEPADRGTYKRYRALIQALNRLGEVDCCTLVDRELEPAAVQRMQRYTNRLHTPVVQFQAWKSCLGQAFDDVPANVRHWFDPQIVNGIANFFADREYDLVIAGDLVSIPYVQAAGLQQFPVWIDRARVDLHFQEQKDAHSARGLGRRLSDMVRRNATARYERRVAGLVAGEIVCAPSDKAFIRDRISTQVPVQVVANGIERDEFPNLGALSDKPVVMIPGAMDYQANVEGVLFWLKEVWPLVRAARPDAECHLVGRDPVEAIRAYDGKQGITVTGSVPSMLPWYRKARCVAAPIHIGGGTRLKVVECWSVGRPLVATGVAVDGLDAQHGQNSLLGETPQELAQCTLALLNDAQQAEAIRHGGNKTAEKYGWEACFESLARHWLSLYQTANNNPGGTEKEPSHEHHLDYEAV